MKIKLTLLTAVILYLIFNFQLLTLSAQSIQEKLEILPQKMIGLDLEKESAESIYEKYTLSFSAVCYCNAIAVEISGSEIIFTNYCSHFKITEESKYYKYEIDEVKTVGNKTRLKCKNPFYEISEFEIEFINDPNSVLFKVTTNIRLPFSDMLRHIYINLKDMGKFKIAECGDYDG